MDRRATETRGVCIRNFSASGIHMHIRSSTSISCPFSTWLNFIVQGEASDSDRMAGPNNLGASGVVARITVLNSEINMCLSKCLLFCIYLYEA